MDPEQTFLRVHARLSGMLAQLLTPKIRRTLEFASLAVALTLFGLLTVMHVNFVAQPGCASDLSGSEINEAQLVQIKITSHGPWSQKLHNVFENSKVDNHQFPETIQVSELHAEGFNFLAVKSYFSWLVSITGRKKPATLLLRNTDNNNEGPSMKSVKPLEDRGDADNPPDIVRFPIFSSLKQWSKFVFNLLKGAKRFFAGYTKPWKITRWKLLVGSSEGSNILPLRVLDSAIVKWIERKSKIYEPTYLYTIEKGYLMLPDGAKSRHNVRTVNISISAQNACFGNRMQQLILNAFVGYDTILMNSLLAARGQGYLYNFQTKELYDLNHPKEPIGEKWSFEDYLVSKCGVLIMSLFVFFTTTMSVSFTLRETQSRMLKFTVQLQHHAQHRLPTFQLIFVHVIESLVFVPIMIGILFFLFEFYDDQLLAFMVLTFVWLCELFTMISVRTPMSMQYFPRFFLLYFLVFHIYFFSYAYGFSYLAFAATAAFMQHLILYFWNRFEIPALQRFLQQRGQMQALHIGSPAVLTSAFVARFNSPTNVVAPNPVREIQTEGINFNSGVAASRLHSASSEGPRVTTGQRERGFHQGDGAPFYHPLNNSQNRRVADLGIGVPPGDLSSSSAMGFDADSMRVLDSVMMENSDHLNGIRASTEASAPVFRPALQTSASPVSTHNPLTSFSSLLLWILGGPPDGIASLNMFRDSRARRTANTGSSEQQNHVLRRTWWSDLGGLESVRRRYRFSHQLEQR